MTRVMVKDYLDKISKEDLVYEYIDNNLSANDIAIKFNLPNKYFALKLLKYYNIEKDEKSKRLSQVASYKKNCLEKYGVDNYGKTRESIEKEKKTKLEKYDDSRYINVEKIKQTNLERYDVDNYRKSKECKEQLTKISQEKYNVDWFSQSEHSKQKYKDTIINKYGSFDNYMKETHANIRETKVKNETLCKELAKETIWDSGSKKYIWSKNNEE